ncbi:hypothetical protein GCM10022392_05090 [Mucilaginibacter panaciglaebae]|uniref:Glycosyltransferase 2-like domain-containing protein n=2 Tax=Mucilaginibacter panaciglaebae TaxID=502331 RepID=A0ABP7WEV8_9SPHI
MSVYNGSDYVRDAINSILEQTFKDFEFIIINDGSTDESSAILRKYAAIDPRIVLLENEVNIGLPKSLNKAIQIAQGEFIARQDADDISSLNRLMVQMMYATHHPEIDLIGANCYTIDINSDIVCLTDHYSGITDLKSTLLEKKAIFSHGVAFIRKTALINAGLYDERFFYSQDGELWLRMLSKNAQFKVLDELLYFYRVLPVSNFRKGRAQRCYNDVKKMMYLDGIDETTINNKLQEIADNIRSGRYNSPVKNHIGVYWKCLANTAYFNKCANWRVPFKYLKRAYKESLSIFGNIKFIPLAVLYLLPPKLTRRVYNSR